MFFLKNKGNGEKRSIKSLFLPIGILVSLALLYTVFAMVAANKNYEEAEYLLKIIDWVMKFPIGG